MKQKALTKLIPDFKDSVLSITEVTVLYTVFEEVKKLLKVKAKSEDLNKRGGVEITKRVQHN